MTVDDIIVKIPSFWDCVHNVLPQFKKHPLSALFKGFVSVHSRKNMEKSFQPKAI